MASIIESLRLLADPTRMRILLILRQEEMSVIELQEVLSMGQSRISSQLSQLKQAGLVEDRRSGKNMIYGLQKPKSRESAEINAEFWALLDRASDEIPERDRDVAALKIALEKREDKARAYFDELAGKFGKNYVPGRSWKGVAEMLLKLMPPQTIADLGAGEGTLAQLMAQRAEKVIAVDISEKMVEFGANLAKEHGFTNLEFRQGDVMDPPIEDTTVDMALFSQALHHARKPAVAMENAYRILKPGGRVVVLDLFKHNFEKARELYADVWLGFSEVEITTFFKDAGFVNPEVCIVHRETERPNFQTLLAIAEKPG